MKPLVSVIIPAWNRAEMIGASLESVYHQAYPNLEVIVVDDGSTDHTASIMKHWQKKGCVYLRHEKNSGACAARNTGIKAASGAFIAFLDSDDWWDSDKIAKQVERMLECGDSTVMVYTGIRKVDSAGRYLGRKLPQKRGKLFTELLRENCIGSTSTALVRTDALRDAGGFDTSLRSRQDLDLWLRLARSGTIEYVKEPLVVYQVHDDRISSNLDARIQGYERVLEKYRKEIQRHPSIHASYWYQLGWFRWKKGETEQAAALLKKSLLIFPKPKTLWYLMKVLGGRQPENQQGSR